jgi:hypothetical protein
MGKLGGHVGHLGKIEPSGTSDSGALLPDKPASNRTERRR